MLLTVMMLSVTMLETGLHPMLKEDRNTWQQRWCVFKPGVGAVRSQLRLVNILCIGLFYRLYNADFDHLGPISKTCSIN